MLACSVVLCLILSASAALAADSLPGGFRQAEFIFVGEVESSRLGPAVGRSYPPLYSVFVKFAKAEMIRGAEPPAGEFAYTIRTNDPPEHKNGSKMLVAGRSDGNRLVLIAHAEATEANIAAAKKLASVPCGWTFDGDKPVSPWAALGEKAWPKTASLKADLACSKTSRPALLAGKDISLKAEQVIPEKVQQYVNPFGDGKFKVTVTNNGKDEVDVPALLTDGKDVLWAASIVVMHGDKAYALPGAAVGGDPKPVRLKPGESVSGVVDVLPLEGPPWPRGGSRIAFSFCLGELSASNFFYYFSNYHDRLRAEAKKKQ